jgi:hypothetical protein
MDRIVALKHVLEDEAYSTEEKITARLALENIAANAATGHERESARHFLNTLDVGNSPVDEIPLSDQMLRLLYLVDTEDTPENNERAREMYRWHRAEMSSNEHDG